MTHSEQVKAVMRTASEVGGTVREDYSGRHMYGSMCYGVVCDNVNECIEMAATHGLRGARIDSMGMRSIIYWPDIEGQYADD